MLEFQGESGEQVRGRRLFGGHTGTRRTPRFPARFTSCGNKTPEIPWPPKAAVVNHRTHRTLSFRDEQTTQDPN